MANILSNLKVSKNQRYLTKEDGSLFFWMGDTAWELFHRLNKEEAELYLRNRAELKFNVIQAVALAEFEGVTTGNAYGKLPLLQNSDGQYDPALPDLTSEYHYWDHVDYIVNKAAELGLYIGFLPTWGDKYNQIWGKGPEVFTEENARIYGKWLGNRYKDYKNIIWVLGGDRHLVTRKHMAIIHSMAEGIREGDGGCHLMTFHPRGNLSSSYHVHNEEWLDMNMIQSGHGALKANYTQVGKDYELLPVKPTLDAEPCYEDHPVSFNPEKNYFDAADVRRAAYWAVFAGACGHTYGHHSIWSMTTEPQHYFIMHWKDALHRPGASQMQHLRNLIESKQFLDYAPDQSLIIQNYPGANHMQASRSEYCAFIYNPSGMLCQVNMGKISGDKVKACWYDPRLGVSHDAGEFENQGERTFFPPSAGRGQDWVLVLENACLPNTNESIKGEDIQ